MRVIIAALAAMVPAAPVFAATPPGAINMIVAGPPDPGGKVPAFNAVPGAEVPNLSIAIPQATLTHGTRFIYWVSFEDFSFTGTCVVSYQLSQTSGTKKILAAQKILSFNCTPGLWSAAIYAKAVPNSPGIGALTGIVAFGGTKVRLNTVVNIQ